MSAQSDEAKGHAKEAAGLLTGNEDLQTEGRAERLAGEAQERTDKVNEVLDKAKKAVRRTWSNRRGAPSSGPHRP